MRIPCLSRAVAECREQFERTTACGGRVALARVAACVALLDRGWGRPPQAHTGENGEGDIRVTIRHIVQEISAAKVIDHKD